MDTKKPTLHLLCGKIAAGKSTLTARLGSRDATIVIAEDDWITALYGDQVASISDYFDAMAKLRKIVAPHVVSLLEAGVSVVLDFQANTVASRNWMRGILDQTDADHQLHLLDVPDEICLARLHARNARGDHPFAATEDHFRQVTRHFVAPAPDEGFNIVLHRPDPD